MDLSVLILTGAQETRSALSRIFAHHGWDVREGAAKADAAEWLTREPARLIVTDSKLPDGNWLDILALAQEVAPEIQVVVTDPHADEALWAEVLYRGAFDVIVQPLDEHEVVRVGQSAVRSRDRARRAMTGHC
jgi:two-component system, NtrC family, response regulator